MIEDSDAWKAAFAAASLDGGRQLVFEFDRSRSDPNRAWALAWSLSRKMPGKEALRTMAFLLAREELGPVAQAVQLWLLSSWTGSDFSTVSNALASVERFVPSGMPSAIRTSVAPFLVHCGVHSEPLVRHGVLDLLELSVAHHRFPEFIDQRSAVVLGDLLSKTIPTTGFADELETLKTVVDALNSPSLPRVLPSIEPSLSALLTGLSEDRALADLALFVGSRLKEERMRVDGGRKRASIAKLLSEMDEKKQYDRQLERLHEKKITTEQIEETVSNVFKKISVAKPPPVVIYGDPQSGKTEMMICLTAKLLDTKSRIVVHLVTDNVSLMGQSMERFTGAGLAPAPRASLDFILSEPDLEQAAVVFCKKNAKDLAKLAKILKGKSIVVIDDEADNATPNGKVNKKQKTRINQLVEELLSGGGQYIGVTATPARLNLNNTFKNKTEAWVRFRPHANYAGQDVFFPPPGSPLQFRLVRLDGVGSPDEAKKALARFLVSVAFLNLTARAEKRPEENYSFLVHTSGRTSAHGNDRKRIQSSMTALVSRKGSHFDEMTGLLVDAAELLYPGMSADELVKYVLGNASRHAFVLLNSKSKSRSSSPVCPYTVFIGGNIVSRGVTFNNLLAMFFTRNVTARLQQDTYIQRARMFGDRRGYLSHFELTVPKRLYADWHRCFVFHRLALSSMERNHLPPTWMADARVAVASSASIDRATVDFGRGEMSFELFKIQGSLPLDSIIKKAPTAFETLAQIVGRFPSALPDYLLEYLKAEIASNPEALAIHTCGSVEGYSDVGVRERIERAKGFIGTNQLEAGRFPVAVHHIKAMLNGKGLARFFYKNSRSGVQFIQNSV